MEKGTKENLEKILQEIKDSEKYLNGQKREKL